MKPSTIERLQRLWLPGVHGAVCLVVASTAVGVHAGCGSGATDRLHDGGIDGVDGSMGSQFAAGSDRGICVPRTCAQQRIQCGAAGDGCGGQLACGNCSAPETCGGGGQPNVCGVASDGGVCVPTTCDVLGYTCGPAGDGCGGLLNCGTCAPPFTCGGGGEPSICGGAAAWTMAFPLKPSADGKYLLNANGVPILLHGEASWDAHFNLDLTDLRSYLDDRQAKGINALFTYVASPVAHFVGSSAPWAQRLGGRSAGVSALPFSTNAAGGPWDGDPTFEHHDANFAYPNDAYFSWVAQFVDEAAARGMVVMLAPMYLGEDLGAKDGWYQTLANSANTQSVCYEFGKYLAAGHSTFAGLKSRQNIIWVNGGDMLPPNGSEAALRALQILKGLQDAGDMHVQTAYWQHDNLTTDQSEFAPLLTAYAAYTHGPYPAIGPTYAEIHALMTQSRARPTWLLETGYWGEYGTSRADLRLFHWGASLSTMGGTIFGFTPLSSFVTSDDGTTANRPGTSTTSWTANTKYNLNQYVSRAGQWYRATAAGQSAAVGPTGAGSDMADGTVTWTFVGAGGWSALLNEPAVRDFQRLGSFFQLRRWCDLLPSGLYGMQTLVVDGTGAYARWSDGNGENGGMDWVIAAAESDGSALVAYVPNAHTGSLTVAMSAMRGASRARWYDPSEGTYVPDSSGAGYVLPNSQPHTFTVPGPNSEGASDWVLVLEAEHTGQP